MTNNSSDSVAQLEKEAFREKQERMEHLARQFNDDAEGLRLHHELCNPAVAEAASQCRVVWAQVKGYPYWPAQILLPKDAKIRFRDTAQEYSEKRMATHRPVHFFVTREISWVLSKQVKSWAQGVADGCHTKNRMNGTFRDSLLQVCDLLYGRKAPSGFTKPTQPAVRQRSAPSPSRPRLPPASPAGAASAPHSQSPQQGRSAPRNRPHNSAEHFAEEVERSRNAILGGMSRDERHRRREESRATEAAPQPSPSDTLSPPASLATQATATVNTHPPLQPRAAAPAQPPNSSSGGAEGASVGRGPGTPGSSAAAAERDSGGENAPKRHTRSQGVAELGMSDLRNLEPRKVPRRGGASVPHVTTSGMGSRATGDGATGRPPAETPQSVGMAPFADARPRSISVSLPAEFGARCLPGSPRSAHIGGDMPSSTGAQEGGSTRQAQSAGPVLSTPAAGPPCEADTTSPRKRPRVADAETGGEDSAKNGADSSVLQQTGVDVSVYSGAVATSASKQPGLDLSVGPAPRECPPVVCQEGSDVLGPTSRAAESVEFPRAPPPPLQQPPAAVSPPANVASEVTPEVPEVLDASPATLAPREIEKATVTSQVVKAESVAATAPPEQATVEDIIRRQDVSFSQLPKEAPAQHAPLSASAVAPASDQQMSDRHCDQRSTEAAVIETVKPEELQQEQPAPQQAPRNGLAAIAPRTSPDNGVSLATQDQEMQDVGGSVNGEDDAEAEAPAAEAVTKRPRRAARAARKTAQELVNGEAARGVLPQRSTERSVSRGAEGGSRNTSGQKAGGGQNSGAAPQRRKSATVTATASEVQPPRRTRSANGPMSGMAMAPQDELMGQGAASPEAHADMPVLLSAATGGKITPHAVHEQISVLHAQPQTEETKQYLQQLQAMLQSLQAQAVVDAAGALRSAHAVAVPPTMAAPPPARPTNMVSVREAITGMFSRGCDVPVEVKEFVLPHEYMLMRTSQHQHSDVNKYPPEIKPKRLRKDVQICTCTRRPEYKRSDTYCCGDGCLNRSASILCDPRSCPCRGDCQNKPFNLRKQPAAEVMVTESRGKGLFAREAIGKDQFVVEYTGEVMNETERLSRMVRSRNNGELHFYIMELSPGLYIDAAHVGSNARFMNSSCDPNCETQKWKDAATGETRIGLFTTRPVSPGEELTYDYHFQHAGLQNAAQGFRCMCGSANCRGTMDENPERMRDAGRKVRIKWDDDDKWYEGYVLRYHPNTRKHTIYYPVDGDAAGTQETLLLDDVEHIWMDDAMTAQLPVAVAAASAAASAAAGVAGVPPAPPPLKASAINPATGLPAGQAAVNATLERARREQVQGSAVEQQVRAAAVAPEQAAAPVVTAPAVRAAAPTQQSTAAHGAAGEVAHRVPLPRPLPMHPPESIASPELAAAVPAAHADGLELLSSVAASLPDRSHTPAIARGAEASTEITDGGLSSMAAAAVSAPGGNADTGGLSQMPMFAVLALLQPRITDTSQLQRAPLPAAEPATLAPPLPTQAALEQQQQILQTPLHTSAAQQQALAAVVAAVTTNPERLAAQQQQQPQVVPQASATGLQPSGAAVPLAAQGSGSPASPQADSPATSVAPADQVMRTISPSPATQAPQVLTQSPHAPAQEFPFPAINQYQALQSMQASMHAQAAQAQQQAAQLQTPPQAQAQSQQQASQALQSATQPHAQQATAAAQQAAQQQAQLQLLAANWPQHAQPTLAASMQAMLQQVITGMHRGDGSAASPVQTALSMQQQQQMLRLAASLPVQVAASQPVAGQAAMRVAPSQAPPATPSAAALGAQHQHAAPTHSTHAVAGALHMAHASSAAGAPEAPHPVQTQGAPTTAAAQASVAALLSAAPRSPSAAVRSVHESVVTSLSQTASAHSAPHGGLHARDHPGPFPTSPAAAAAVVAGPAEPSGTHGAPTSGPSAFAQSAQMLGTSSEQRSRAHGGAAPSAEAAPHPMRFAEQLQRGAGDARAASLPMASCGHAAPGVHEVPASMAPMASSAVPAAAPGSGRVSAFMVSGEEAPARGLQGGSEHALHVASAGAPAAPPPTQPNGGAPAAVHAGGEGGDAASRHWLLALNVNEDTIRTWYSYARDHLKIADPLHDAHRGDFMKFMSDLQKSMAIHQYMAQARSQQPQHAAPTAQAPVLGQMVTHAAPQMPWTGAVSGGQPQAPVQHVPHWGFRPH